MQKDWLGGVEINSLVTQYIELYGCISHAVFS